MLRKAISILGAPGHGDLVSLIYNEKAVGEAFTKAVSAEKEASQSLAKWSAAEENATLRDLVSRMAELDELKLKIWAGFTEEYETYRKIFKEILKGEKMLDDARKEVDNLKSKTVKIAKQLETLQTKKKTDTAKMESLDAEYAKAISSHDEGMRELRLREENHAHFKYAKVREALYVVTRAGSTLHEQSSIICDAREKLLQIYPKTMAKSTIENYNQAQKLGEETIEGVSKQLQIQRENTPRDRRASDAPESAGGQPRRSGSVSEALMLATAPGAVAIKEPEVETAEDQYTYQPIPDREGDAYDNIAPTVAAEGLAVPSSAPPKSPPPTSPLSKSPSSNSPPPSYRSLSYKSSAPAAPVNRAGSTSSNRSHQEGSSTSESGSAELTVTPAGDGRNSPNSVHRPLPPIPAPRACTTRQISEFDGTYDVIYVDPSHNAQRVGEPPSDPTSASQTPGQDKQSQACAVADESQVKKYAEELVSQNPSSDSTQKLETTRKEDKDPAIQVVLADYDSVDSPSDRKKSAKEESSSKSREATS